MDSWGGVPKADFTRKLNGKIRFVNALPGRIRADSSKFPLNA
jgi:hypothetical protein